MKESSALSHVSGITIERGDLVVTTGSGQRIKPWPYLASVAGALSDIRRRRPSETP